VPVYFAFHSARTLRRTPDPHRHATRKNHASRPVSDRALAYNHFCSPRISVVSLFHAFDIGGSHPVRRACRPNGTPSARTRPVRRSPVAQTATMAKEAQIHARSLNRAFIFEFDSLHRRPHQPSTPLERFSSQAGFCRLSAQFQWPRDPSGQRLAFFVLMC